MGTRARPATRSVSKTPLTPPSRWLVSASVSWIVTDLERDLASPELKVVAEPVALTAEHAKTFASELEAKNGAVSCAVSF